MSAILDRALDQSRLIDCARNAAMMQASLYRQRSTTQYIQIHIAGHRNEIEVEIFYDATPAERGYREPGTGLALGPDFAARVTICRVMSGGIDVLPALPASTVRHLEKVVMEEEHA